MEVVKNTSFLREFLKDNVYIVKEQARYSILVLFKHPDTPYLSESEEDFLEKILQAVGIRLNEARLVNIDHQTPEDSYDSLEEVPASHVVSFGVPLTQVGLDLTLEKYQVQQLKGIHLLLADTLSEISENREQKKRLWNALRQMFQL